jgi:Fe-S-cluster containining protein
MGEQTPVPAETVTVEFSIGLREGTFKASAIVPAGQTNLTQILPVLQSLDDSLIAGVAAQLTKAGLSVSCKLGCAACCRQMVPLCIFEAEALTTWIRSLPEARQRELDRRFDDVLRKFAAAGLIDRMVNEDWLAETESARQLASEYLHQRIACPFLENESCSIYPIRPLACREYVVTSPPEHCYDPATLMVKPLPLPLKFARALSGVGAKLESDSRGWIPLIFLFAWMKAEAHPGDAFSGEGPQVLYEFVKNLEHGQPPS